MIQHKIIMSANPTTKCLTNYKRIHTIDIVVEIWITPKYKTLVQKGYK